MHMHGIRQKFVDTPNCYIVAAERKVASKYTWLCHCGGDCEE